MSTSNQRETTMSVQLLVIYPPPANPAEFDRDYREKHLPYAGPRLMGAGATGVATTRSRRAGGKPVRTLDFRYRLSERRHRQDLCAIEGRPGSFATCRFDLDRRAAAASSDRR